MKHIHVYKERQMQAIWLEIEIGKERESIIMQMAVFKLINVEEKEKLIYIGIQ